MLKLSLNELKQVAKMRWIKSYKSMSEERLISSINESEPVKESEKNFDKARIEKIKKHFNKLKDRLSNLKIKDIRKDLYRKENKKNLSTTTINETEKVWKLEKNLSKLKKYYNYDDIEYRGVRGVKNLLDLSIDKF